MSNLSIPFVKLDPRAKVPTRAHDGDAGYDLYATEEVSISPGQRRLIKTGIAMAIPEGYYGQILDRSGLALKGLHVTGGVIDSAYRSDVGVILTYMCSTRIRDGGLMAMYAAYALDAVYKINAGDRIAQIVIKKCEQVDFVPVESLDNTARGEGGFGSTGT